MDQAPFPATASFATRSHDESRRHRRLHSLLCLFALYGCALLVVVMTSDGADIGCILAGIAAHVVYATRRIAITWRDAAWLEGVKVHHLERRRLRLA